VTRPVTPMRVLGDGPSIDIVEGPGLATALVHPDMGALHRSMIRISLGPGSATVAQRHDADAVYFAISGTGAVGEPGADGHEPLVAGAMFHVDAGTEYVVAAGDDGLELVGGPVVA
jgi:mannose-6-phosphate isomerase-like protein (cupin superfamily)